VDLTDGQIAEKVKELFDLRPAAIEKKLQLRNPIYLETAAYGHLGRTPKTVSKKFDSSYHKSKKVEVNLFTWEKLDEIDRIKQAFGL